MFTKIKSTLKPFYKVIKRLEENVVKGLHGAFWEVVVKLKYFIQNLEVWKLRFTKNDISIHQLNIYVGLAISKLIEYVSKTVKSPVWLAALVLHPKYK